MLERTQGVWDSNDETHHSTNQTEDEMLKMLIAVDGSDHSRRAIESVARMARAELPIEVTLLNVREPLVFCGELPVNSLDAIEAAQKSEQDHLLNEAESLALGSGLKLLACQRASGDPAECIVELAREIKADQIVMGTHGRGPLGSLFLGSVSQRVVQASPLPVLLIK